MDLQTRNDKGIEKEEKYQRFKQTDRQTGKATGNGFWGRGGGGWVREER